MTGPRFNGVDLTSATMRRTREHFADIHRRCIADVVAGRQRVNNPESYIAWQDKAITETLAGKNDHTATFLQRAYWLQTGECVALLP
jgi:hypothetical protein